MSADWRRKRDAKRAAMEPQELAEYETSRHEACLRLELAEIAYTARVNAGLTQPELARRSGTKQSTISAIENGRQNPTYDTLARIAAATGTRICLIPLDPEPVPAS